MMNSKQIQSENYIAASRRVKEIKGFYLHLTTFFVINLFLLLINYFTFWEHQWFWYPLTGWGIGLCVHGVAIFSFGKSWEVKKIREILENEKNN